METKGNNSESNKVATTEKESNIYEGGLKKEITLDGVMKNEAKKAQKLSVSFTVRALIENINRLEKAGLIEAKDVETVKEIGTRATLKGLGL